MPLKEPTQPVVPLTINLHITVRGNQPVLEMRRHILESDAIKTIISCAYYERPIIIQPIFQNKFRALASLIDKGILHRDEKGEYQYNI